MYAQSHDAYLAHALKLLPAEKDLIASFREWLPDPMIDCHSHSNLPAHVKSLSEQARAHMMSTFSSFSLEESEKINRLLHPDAEVRMIRFANAFQGIDHAAANSYLLENSPSKDRVALYGLPDNPEYTIQMLGHPRVSALKMYPAYFSPPAREVYEYFPPEVLSEAERRDVPIILHPPRPVTECLAQLLQLFRDFPRLRISLAHLGLSKFPVPGLKEAFRAIGGNPLLRLDTALCPSAEVVRLALEEFGPQRIMYGSDQPLDLLRSQAYAHPEKGERIVTSFRYHWTDAKEHELFAHLAKNSVHAHWQTLSAIRSALAGCGNRMEKNAKLAIFHNNAAEFFGF